MALTYFDTDREIYVTRSWQENSYDNSSYNTVYKTRYLNDKVSQNSPRDVYDELLLRENPCRLYRGVVKRAAVGISLNYGYLKRHTTTSDFSPAALSAPQWSDHEPALRDSAWRSVISDVQEVKANLGQLIAERQSLVNALVSVMTRTHNFISAVKRGDVRKALGVIGLLNGKGRPSGRHTARDLSGLYLEFQLAILPAAKDIYALANKALRNPYIRASRSRTYKGEFVYTQSSSYGTYTTESGFSTRVNVTAKAYIPNAQFLAANIAQQLGLVNPVALAWELVPLSFVINWFTGIGQFLSQFDAFVGLEIIELSETTTRKQAILSCQFSLAVQPGFPRGECSAVMRRRPIGHTVEKNRILVPKVPIIRPSFPLLNGLSVGKLVTLTALLTQFKTR